MTEAFEISLVGALSYGTLRTVYQKGVPAMVTAAEWEALRDLTNPADGGQMFCLTSDLPPAPVAESNDISVADLRASGLTGEIDTGAPVVNTMAILDDKATPQVDADGEEFPQGAPDDAPTGVVTMEPAPKRVVIGKGKSVAV